MRYRTSRILEAMHAERPNEQVARAAALLRERPASSFHAAMKSDNPTALWNIAAALNDRWALYETRNAFVQRIADKLVAEAERLGVPMEDV